jgi:hypothetical protein
MTPLQTDSPKESEEPLFFYFTSVVQKMDSPLWSFLGEAVFKKNVGRAYKKWRSQS